MHRTEQAAERKSAGASMDWIGRTLSKSQRRHSAHPRDERTTGFCRFARLQSGRSYWKRARRLYDDTFATGLCVRAVTGGEWAATGSLARNMSRAREAP